MKYTCAKSGFVITTPEFRHSLADNSHSATHPIFSARPQLLLRAFDDFLASKLNDQEIILLYLAIADSTGLLTWRSRFEYTPEAPGLLASKLEALVRVSATVKALAETGDELPGYVVCKQDAQNTAAGFARIVTLWTEGIAEIELFNKNLARNRALIRAEEHMDRSATLMRKRPAQYARAVASWAATVGEFAPAVSEVWQKIIIGALIKDCRYHSSDVLKVLEYCEENVPAGSTHAFTLFDGLRTAYAAKVHVFGVDRTAKYQNMLSPEDFRASEREVALLKEMRKGAPTVKPNRADFPNAFLFLRALAAWNAAQKELPEEAPDFVINVGTGDSND